MRRLVTVLLGILVSSTVSAQLLQPVYSAPSPQSASLGEYGEVPVSHFTGTPQVSVPLFEVEAGDYKYPVGLSYHLGSVKPHAQPGPVGFGWMLTDACINRTVRGVYDEKKDDGNNGAAHGYYGHYSEMLGITNEQFRLKTQNNLTGWDSQTPWFELSADEFSFNVNGHSGLFYLNPDGDWTVISDEDIVVEFNPSTGFLGWQDLNARFFNKLGQWAGRAENARWFKGFTLITPDGIRYEFGGVDAIDFSVPYYDRGSGDLVATAWHLKRITTPKGYVITFDYSTDQILCDLHYATGRTTTYDVGATSGDVLHHDIRGRAGLSGFLLYPAAVTRIAGPADTLNIMYTQNESYNSAFRDRYPEALYWEDSQIRTENLFHYSTSNPQTEFFELLPVSDTGNERQNQQVIANCFRHDVVYRIARTPRYGGTGFTWYFSLSSSARPKLMALYSREGVPELEYDWIEGGGVMYPRLRMPTNTSSTSLPEWHFGYCGGKRMPDSFLFPTTDAWGSWDGGEVILSQTYSPRSESPAPLQYARVDALKELYYPTGGRVTFEYERNDYGKLARADHSGVDASSGSAGGLRIRSVTLTDRSGKVHGVSRYHYVNGVDSGGSSGIASALPPASVHYFLHGGDAGMTVESSEGFPAVSTNRNTPAVGYSSVTEERLDSAGATLGYIRYRYSNFDADLFGAFHPDEPFFYSYNCGDGLVGVPYTSNSSERGRLQSKEWYDAQKALVRKETMRYSRVCNDSLTVADQRVVFLTRDPVSPEVAHMGWLSRTRTYSYLPVETQVTEYTSGGTVIQGNTTAYNAFKLPSSTASSRSDGTSLQKSFTYSGDTPLYSWMSARHILDSPVSVQTSVGNVSRMETASYAQSTNALGSPVPYVDRVTTSHAGSDDPKTVYEVLSVDAWGNPLDIRADGMRSSLEWRFDGQRLHKVRDNAPVSRSSGGSRGLRSSPVDFAVVMEEFDGSLERLFLYREDLLLGLTSDPNYLASVYSYDALQRQVRKDETDGSDGWGERRVLDTAYYAYPAPVLYPSEGYQSPGNVTEPSGGASVPTDPNEPESFDPIREVDLASGYVPTLSLEYRSDEYHYHHPTNRGVLHITDTTEVCFKVSGFTYYHDSGEPLTLDAARLDLSLFHHTFSSDSLFASIPLCVDSQTLLPFTWPDPTDTTGYTVVLPPGQYEVVFGGITCVSLNEGVDPEPNPRRGNPTDERIPKSRDGMDPTEPNPVDPTMEYLLHFPAFTLRMECLPLSIMEEGEEEEPVVMSITDWNVVRRGVSRDGTASNVSLTVDWHDDFGRKEISVASGANPSGHDLVTLLERDGWGREIKAWLPSESTVALTNGNPGPTYVRTLAQATFGLTEKPYSLTEYEQSALSRVTGQYGPGAAWQNGGKKVSTDYLTNTATGTELSCRRFTCTASSGGTSWTVSSLGNYAAGMLHVIRTTDEDGRQALEFKDFDGNTVLLRTRSSAGQYLDTYYVYDALGNLQCVLPPLASGAVSGGTIPLDALQKYAYLYTYDDRDRCIVKKLPGAAPVYFVYDEADRVVLTQDGNTRAMGKALFSLYDVFGRAVVTGTCDNTVMPGDRLRTYAKATYAGSSGALKGYDVEGISLVNPEVLNASWYDTHSFVCDVFGLTLSGSDTTLVYGQPTPLSTGLQTGSWSALLGDRDSSDPAGTWSILRYDRRNRVAKTLSSTHEGGRIMEDVEYTFRGSPLKRHIVHTDALGYSFTEDYASTYDHEERLLTEKHSLNGADSVILVSNAYDNLGRLLSNGRAGSPQYTTTYGYNIRSWTTGISSPFFSETLYYNSPRPGSSSTAQWGGNVSSMEWDASDAYDYAYDGLSRLTGATHDGDAAKSRQYAYDAHGNITGLTAGGTQRTYTYSGNHLSTSQYDANGNVTADNGTGIAAACYNVLDLPEEIIKSNGDTVRYVYSASGVKLRERVIPLSPSGLTICTDYVGNLVYRDGLLGRILVDGGAIAAKDSTLAPAYEFAYTDHLGSVRALVQMGDSVYRKTEYGPYGEVLSENWTSQLVSPGGGNGGHGEIIEVSDEEDDPGSGGGPRSISLIQTRLDNPYRFGGKERLDASGLDLYDFGARYYNPALPRWLMMDPLAEKYYYLSPYAYCDNNPLSISDFKGDSLAVLNQGPGIGHIALLIQNKGKKWEYYSYNGDWVYKITNQQMGGKPYHDTGNRLFDSPRSFLNGPYNSKGTHDQIMKDEINNYGFAEAYILPTTPEQDDLVREWFMSEASVRYGLFGHECADVVEQSLQAGGIQAEGILSFLPNPLFKLIQKNNSGELITR